MKGSNSKYIEPVPTQSDLSKFLHLTSLQPRQQTLKSTFKKQRIHSLVDQLMTNEAEMNAVGQNDKGEEEDVVIVEDESEEEQVTKGERESDCVYLETR